MLCTCLTVSAQNLKNFYRQAPHAEGALYFVLPQQMSEAKSQNGMLCESLSYDYTYLDSRDSVTLLLTLTTKEIFRADSLQIETPSGQSRKYGVQTLYYNPVKNCWECRIRTVIPYKEWEAMYHSVEPFALVFSSAESEERLRFSDKPSKWEKIRSRYVHLQDLIRLNKKP